MAVIRSAQLVVGMEVHVELATRSKLFSRSPNPAHPEHFDAPPNTLLDPYVVALPGALPVMNRAAVDLSIMVGLALGCDIARQCRWDRKNYFYPDLPKGYQISQYQLPLCFDGEMTLDLPDGSTHRIGIIRAHLEEDTGKLGHDSPAESDNRAPTSGAAVAHHSLLDLNRAGTPLLEIVTRPDFRTVDQCVQFCHDLRTLCRFLNVTEADMQRGHMRFEPNINVEITTNDGRTFTTPIVEVKNLNSFRSVRAAIAYECDRQIESWKQHGEVMGPGMKRTRGWDDVRCITVLQREKEDAHDYRYFPEPDLPELSVDDAWRERIAATLPELPAARRRRYIDEFELDAKDADALTADRSLCEFFEQCVTETYGAEPERGPVAHAGGACAKLLLNTAMKYANDRNCGVHELGISPRQVAGIVALRDANRIGSSAADDLFVLLCESDDDAETVAAERGLLQVRDSGQLEQWVNDAIDAQPDSAEDYRQGKDAAIGRLIGEVMQRSGGKADARAVRDMLHQTLRG